MKTIKDIKSLKNKKVLVRVDFNCPIKEGKVVNDFRIKKALPTIKYLKKQGAKVILISHLGRPKGKRNNNFSLKPVYNSLKKYLPKTKFINDCIGEKVEEKIKELDLGDILLLENLRFYPGEKQNDPEFAKKLANGKDIFINNAFGVSHRKHASVYGVLDYLNGFAGILLKKEVENINTFINSPKHPFVVLMGGVKAATKIKTIEKLTNSADKILLGGGLANTFVKAKGGDIKDSFYEPEMIKKSKKLLKNKNIVLPIDFSKTKAPEIKFYDIGEKTIKSFSKILENAKMILWNGPLGYFEKKDFSQGTIELANTILKNTKAKVLVGGGETVTALFKLTNYSKQKHNHIFVSTGGGSLLKFLSQGYLLAINKLKQ